MYSLKRFFLHSPGHYIGAVVVAAAVIVFRMLMLPEDVGFRLFWSDDLAAAGETALYFFAGTRFAWYDALSVAGGVTFFVGALLTVSYFGAFNLFGYVFSPGRLGEHRKYKSYAHYCQIQEESRSRLAYYFVPYYVVGTAVFLIAFFFA